MRQNARSHDQTWSAFDHQMAGKKLFLFGAGKGAEYFLDHYIRQYTVEGIIDNDPKIQGCSVSEVLANAIERPYVSMRISDISVLQRYDAHEVVVLITSLKYCSAILDQLEQEGVSNCFILASLDANILENVYAQREKSAISRYIQESWKKPVNEKKIVFHTLRGYSGHGKSIAEELLKCRNDLDIVWLVDDLNITVPDGVRLVYWKNKRKFIFELSTAKLWVLDDGHIPAWLNKRVDQIYVQIKHWSSVTLKTFALKVAEFQNNQASIDMCRHNARLMDYLLTGSDFDERTCREGFDFSGEMIRVGSPRSDILFHQNECRAKIEKHYSLSANSKFALYAPTFRIKKDKNGIFDAFCDLNFNCLKEAMAKKFGGEWTVLLRLHPIVAAKQREMQVPEGVVPVSDYPDSQELVAASDIIITDYSSIMFEPAFVRKPVFLLATDLEDYLHNERDLLIDYHTLPFPIARSNEELARNIENFDYEKYVHDVDAFMDEYGVHEDGHASERAARFISDLIDGREE